MTTTVIHPLEALQDPALPQLKSAPEPEIMQRHFVHCLKRFNKDSSRIDLQEIRMLRYQPGRCCLIEYTLKIDRPGFSPETLVLLGKTKSGHSAQESFQILDQLWYAGFSADDKSGFSVPEPMGFVSELELWFQVKVRGLEATKLLSLPQGKEIVEYAAEAAYKLHHTKVELERIHLLSDELGFIFEKLPQVGAMQAEWSKRIDRILDALIRLVRKMPEPKLCGIHRNYCSDQVIVDGDHLTLIDFDLYCLGDPALDIGNFIGHITEQSLRRSGDTETLSKLEEAMEDRFIALSGEALRPAVRAYTLLTLVRQIYLSTCFPERRHLTEPLLALCEKRLRIKKKNQIALGPSPEVLKTK